MIPSEPPGGYHAMNAFGFSHAVTELCRASGQDAHNGILSSSIFMLTGFALELGLKAIAAHGGATAKAIRDCGHDLKRARDLADAHGIVVQVASIDVLIAQLQLPHQRSFFRYLEVHGDSGVALPDAHEAAEILDQFTTGVMQLIYGKERRG